MMKYYKTRVKLEKLVPGGQALGVMDDGKKIFVWGGLPGEDVEVEVTKSKKSYSEGLVTKVYKANPNRIESKDECYLSTSPWQIMNYDYELEQKSELIYESFKQNGIELGDKVEVITDGKEFEYRNKMEYSLYWDNELEKVELAFHKRGSHQKVPISGSSIERPEILERAKYIINDINEQKLEARQFSSLMIRCSQDGDVASMLFEKSKPHIKGKTLTDIIMGQEYSYSPNGFFQINLPVYEMALRQMKKHVNDGEVLELYAGVGTIGLSVIARSETTKQTSYNNTQLTMVESDKNAFKELENNVKSSKNGNIKAINAKSEDVLEYLTSDINTLILDPPRAGLDSKVVEKALKTLPGTIIYLSCNPITQARDIALLLESYKIDYVSGFNFFPRTPHIENLVILSATNKVL